MLDEADFLDAIAKNPDDDDLRLVYADWLEERGDLRGEFLRLEHEQRRIPGRMAELRPLIDSTWLSKLLLPRRRVVMVGFMPGRKLAVVKLVKETTGLSLMECRKLVERDRGIVAKNLSWEEAESLANRFQGIGIVAIEPCIEGA